MSSDRVSKVAWTLEQDCVSWLLVVTPGVPNTLRPEPGLPGCGSPVSVKSLTNNWLLIASFIASTAAVYAVIEGASSP